MKTLLAICAVLLMWVSCAAAATIGDAIEVGITTDNGWSLPFYSAKSYPALKKGLRPGHQRRLLPDYSSQ